MNQILKFNQGHGSKVLIFIENKITKSSALVLKIPATTATILPNCETIIVERDRYRVQSRFLRINETKSETSTRRDRDEKSRRSLLGSSCRR